MTAPYRPRTPCWLVKISEVSKDLQSGDLMLGAWNVSRSMRGGPCGIEAVRDLDFGVDMFGSLPGCESVYQEVMEHGLNLEVFRSQSCSSVCLHPFRVWDFARPAGTPSTINLPRAPVVPPQKVFGPSKPTPNTFLEGTWSPTKLLVFHMFSLWFSHDAISSSP